MVAAALALALASTLGCGGSQKDVDALTVRVENLEHQQQERLDQVDDRLSRIEDQNQRLLTINETIASQFSRISEMSQALTEIEAKLDKAPAPRRPTRPRGPQPDDVYAIPVGDSPFEGPANAKVTIVKAFEFACPFCERARSTMKQIRTEYGKDVRIVYKHYIVHAGTAYVPAQAACAAHLQNKFRPMREAIWERGFKAGRNLARENMIAIARDLKLNMRRFRRDMDGTCVERVKRDHAALAKVGVTGTPGFFINGRYLRGAQPFPAFKTVIDEELAKAEKVIRTQGIRPRDYYEKYVVANGKSKP